MAENRYIITKSNYTIKKKHQILPDATIYERDFMTTENLGGFDSGSIPYGEGNFKIITNDDKNLRRKHKYGDWLLNENCIDESGNTCNTFSLDNIPNSGEDITSETKIELKPNKNTFSDFVYYGSCKELIRSSVDDIITNFPAELYVSEYNYVYPNDNGGKSYLGNSSNFVIIDNPFGIDIISKVVPQKELNSPTYNPLRFLAESLDKYEIISGDTTYPIVSRTFSNENDGCIKDGTRICIINLKGKNVNASKTVTIHCYEKDNEIILLTDKRYTDPGVSIRPIQTEIENFFKRLDDFEKILLDRETNPIYTVEIETPSETDRGTTILKRRYTWPIDNGYNLDIISSSFSRYYENLLTIAEWYDQNKSDNLWRNMTHDSIKNMDRTHTDAERDEGYEDYAIGTTKIHDVLTVIARFFDDIKRSIDNIKTINTITYDENNNTPDYFLTDTLQLSGWEVKSAVETINSEVLTDIISGSTKQYDANNANVQFFRNLKLNSKALFSRKGTREGVEMLLSLFGLCSDDWLNKYNELNPSFTGVSDYIISEYVTTVENTSADIVTVDKQLPVEIYSPYRKNFGAPDDGDFLHGLPVRMVYLESGDTTYKYIIPWFDKKETLDGEPYFQMYGGWGKLPEITVTPNKELYPNTTKVETTNEFSVYSETKKYLKIVGTTDELINLEDSDVNDGDVFYVNDISNYTASTSTNYFSINDASKSNVFGGDGWVNIEKDELSAESGGTASGKTTSKVIYLESLVELSDGNNPHVGYGKYDDGEEYLKYFKQIFKGAIDSDGFTDEAYTCNDGELISGITNCGFSVQDKQIDNVKVWYFSDNSKDKLLKTLTSETGYTEMDTVGVGTSATGISFNTELVPFNLETQDNGSNDEAAANSIINVKNLEITFKNRYKTDAEYSKFKDYVNAVILPYVKQVIPSTTIFSVKYQEIN